VAGALPADAGTDADEAGAGFAATTAAVVAAGRGARAVTGAGVATRTEPLGAGGAYGMVRSRNVEPSTSSAMASAAAADAGVALKA